METQNERGQGIEREQARLRQILPQLTLENLKICPVDCPVVALIRHSARGALPKDSSGDRIPLTDEGVRLGVEFGHFLREIPHFFLATLCSSPVIRCLQTADAIMDGLAAKTGVDVWPDLTLPGVFLRDPQAAVLAWRALGIEEVLRRIALPNPEPLPGMMPVDAAAKKLVRMMFAAVDRPGFHFFITHDSVILPVAARLLHTPVGLSDWPSFLEGLFLWRTDDSPGDASSTFAIQCRYRNYSSVTML